MRMRINMVTAFRALRRNKFRSALSMLGIIIGISSVIAMVGLGSSATIAVEGMVQSYGTNALSIKLRGGKNFSAADLQLIKDYIPQIKYITPVEYISEKSSETLHRYRQSKCRSRLYFVGEDYCVIQGRTAAEGRLLSRSDIDSSAKVAVIGSAIKNKLFNGEDPLGKIITVDNFPFTVVGVLAEKGTALSGRDFDSITLFPYTSGLRRFENTDAFSEINMATYYGYEVAQAARQVQNYAMRKFFSGASDPKGLVKMATSDDKLQMARDIATALSMLLAGVAAISLFVGGVGIMNIMLVSVTERTREIGIRMAIGAKQKDIMMQFLFEAVFLSIIGGLGGIILGLGLYWIVTTLVGWPFILSPIAISMAFGFSAAVGIFFGYYPSKKAAQLKPIEALKYE